MNKSIIDKKLGEPFIAIERGIRMKKKILIGISIVLVVVIGVLAYMVISDLGQEEKLKTELEEINAMTNSQDIDINTIYERLDTIVTKGDYAKVEKAFKGYLKDSFDNIIKITEILDDERISNILTANNYLEDGKDFVETKNYIQQTKTELEKCKQEYASFFTEEKVMSYLDSDGLDSYYIDLYKNQYVGDIESASEDKTVENSVDQILGILDISEQVIDLLSENPNSWEVDEQNIMFHDDTLSSKYDELLNKLA